LKINHLATLPPGLREFNAKNWFSAATLEKYKKRKNFWNAASVRLRVEHSKVRT
jgi:hypothetical protein